MQLVHFHIPKTGGTSLNNWLDTLVDSHRVRPADEGVEFTQLIRSSFGDSSSVVGGEWDNLNWNLGHNLLSDEIGRRSMNWWDVVHDHNPGIMRGYAGAYRLVLLREPISRIRSQFNDYLRLTDSDLESIGESGLREMLLSLRCNSFSDFLETYQDNPLFLAIASNVQTRRICAASNYMYKKVHMDFLDGAVKILRDGFNLVGVTERMSEFCMVLCNDISVYPIVLPKVNNSDSVQECVFRFTEIELDFLKKINSHDIKLHLLANELLDKSLSKVAYSAEKFESEFLGDRLQGIKPRKSKDVDSVYYDMNMQIIGSGFHGRDAPGTEDCLCWTSGENVVLYMPVPHDEYILVHLYIQGYINDSPDRTFRLFLDGKECKPEFSQIDGYFEVLKAPIKTRSNYVKIELKDIRCYSLNQLGIESDDKRKRGIAIKRYGYNFMSLANVEFIDSIVAKV